MTITLTDQQSQSLHRIAELQGRMTPECALECLIDQAAEVLTLDRLAKAADHAVKRDGLIPDHCMTYAEWLDWSGRDASFVGNDLDIPGTPDLYDAAICAFDAGAIDESLPSHASRSRPPHTSSPASAISTERNRSSPPVT